MATTKIEWADRVWNPTTGCTPVSNGCDNCYAERMAGRLKGRFGYPADDPFKAIFHPDRMNELDRLMKPQRVFVCSMGDLFHKSVTDGQIMWVFWKMAHLYSHTFLVLTKRPERMADWFSKWSEAVEPGGGFEQPKLARGPDETRKAHKAKRAHLFADMLDLWGEPPRGCTYPTYDWMEGVVTWPVTFPNVHIGISAEDQDAYNRRVPHLLSTPAAVKFLSLEPLLGDIDLRLGEHSFPSVIPSKSIPSQLGAGARRERLDGVIVGGESGPGARPCHPNWVRSIRDQCVDAGVRFMFKSWGEWQNGSDLRRPERSQIVLNNGLFAKTTEELLKFVRYGDWGRYDATFMAKVGKKHSGRTIDGRTWEELY